MTRAYLSLIKFDLTSAFYYHPLFLLPGLIAVVVVSETTDFWDACTEIIFYGVVCWRYLFLCGL